MSRFSHLKPYDYLKEKALPNYHLGFATRFQLDDRVTCVIRSIERRSATRFVEITSTFNAVITDLPGANPDLPMHYEVAGKGGAHEWVSESDIQLTRSSMGWQAGLIQMDDKVIYLKKKGKKGKVTRKVGTITGLPGHNQQEAQLPASAHEVVPGFWMMLGSPNDLYEVAFKDGTSEWVSVEDLVPRRKRGNLRKLVDGSYSSTR